MTDAPLQFAHPEFAPVLWIWLAIVIGLVLLERRRGDALDRLVSAALQDRLVDRPSRWRRWARMALLAVSGFAMGLALMQPQWGLHYVATPRVGAEIMIALDVSRSMLADDAKPSRLERAKAEVSDLLSYLEDDYVGLIAFAGNASVLSPMTPDKNFLRLALDSAGPQSVSRGGTRLAEPILRTVAGMGEPGPAQRALILITDGEDHDSFALDAAKEAAEAGIKIIAIGFGDEAGSEIYVRDPKTGARSLVRDGKGHPVVSRLDGDLLRDLALATDGAFVPAGTGVLDLASIYDAHIAGLTRGQLDERGRSIRDEVYQAPLLVALVCLVAAVLVASGRRSPLAHLAIWGTALSVATGWAPPVQAQVQVQAAAQTPAQAQLEDLAPSPSSTDAQDAPTESPRERFNRANAQLAGGDATAAASLFREARREAADDPVLRYSATYNLGVANVVRSESLQSENPKEALAALHEAADWFREAAAARPEELDPRHNLDVTLRRAMILADEIAQQDERAIEDAIDAMIAVQRERVAQSGVLFEEVARAGELEAADLMRPAFREAATAQRVVLSDLSSLADRVARERAALLATPEAERSPEDALRAAQLDGVLTYLDSAVDRMGQMRRQLRQRRAERAYRRGSSALDDLKRARDQLRDPVEQIGVLLGEVGQLARATSVVAASGLAGVQSGAKEEEDPATSNAPSSSPNKNARIALPLDRESLEVSAAGIEARTQELASRFESAASHAGQTGGALGGSPAAPTAPGGNEEIDAADAEALRAALEAAAPLVGRAAEAMGETKEAIGSGRNDVALRAESEAGQALAAAQEQFFDLRQLLDATYADQVRIATIASSEEPEFVEGRDEYRELLAQLQEKNTERALRLDKLLERERASRIAELEAQAAEAGPPAADESPDPVTLEQERFEIATQRLALASGAMSETMDVFATPADDSSGRPSPNGAIDWPKAGESSERAAEHLDAIRMLFFSIAEHVRKLALDQVDLADRTRDATVLAAEDASERSEDTLRRTRALAEDQSKLEGRGGEIADALFVQAEELGEAAQEDQGPGGVSERDRIRLAAEHVAQAQLAMKDAEEILVDANAALPPAQDAQGIALEELKEALALLSSPPPPQDQPDSGDQDQNQDQDGAQGEPEFQPQEGEGGAQNEPQPDEIEDEMSDPSQLLQGVRDREAERRRERDREDQRRRRVPVEKDW
jgi:Ca-activated chloride channel family protein